MLSDAMNDLQEQVKVENVPAEKPEGGNGKPVSLALPHKFEFLININDKELTKAFDAEKI